MSRCPLPALSLLDVGGDPTTKRFCYQRKFYLYYGDTVVEKMRVYVYLGKTGMRIMPLSRAVALVEEASARQKSSTVAGQSAMTQDVRKGAWDS